MSGRLDLFTALAGVLAVAALPVVTGVAPSWGGGADGGVPGGPRPGRGRRPVAALAAGAAVLAGLGAGLARAPAWPGAALYGRAAGRPGGAGGGDRAACLVAGSALRRGRSRARRCGWRRCWPWRWPGGAAAAGAGAARAAAAADRVALAADVHDVVAHTLAVLGVQLAVAEDALPDDPDGAGRALETARLVRGQAAAELRSLIGALGTDAASGPGCGPGCGPERDLAALAALAERMRGCGLEVVLRQSGRAAAVPGPVAWAVYRVVQESLTNAVKHGRPAGAVEVRVDYGRDAVRLTVTDAGDVPAPAGDDGGRRGEGGGFGLAGMRERVARLGGTLTARPTAAGFTVEAVIPATPIGAVP
ncbi:histidine kinase [Actinomadura sp. ATCC 31491]|uniref:histidine kinase n=1 Tax=Actinomadura luzonensis TaxID=2805427 RepID=A0ABT0G5V7_9ACTN|nr:ATP-binding protein [Actinomadura luzonensis]MCK2219478.1 histidine kinase [Actinomadura luzonensis]